MKTKFVLVTQYGAENVATALCIRRGQKDWSCLMRADCWRTFFVNVYLLLQSICIYFTICTL